MDNIKGTIEHLKEHQEYPATKKELVAACNNLSDFSEEDKKFFTNHLTDKTYDSADEVIEALHLEEKD